MAQEFNIAFAVGEVARKYGQLPAIIAADVTIDYRKYWRITRSFALKMREFGVGRNSLVVVQTRDMIASLTTLHAAALLGARYATFGSWIEEGTSTELGSPDLLLHSPEEQPDPALSAICITPDWVTAAPEEDNGGEFEGFDSYDEPWFLVQTSGTTGTPKRLWLTARQVYLRTKASQDEFTFGKTRFCALFPCNTRPFFARANAALLSACAIVDTVDIGFLQRHKVDLFCASPRTAMEWLGGRKIEPKLPLIQVSGARLEPTHVNTLLQSFCVVEDAYGASETSKTHVNRIEVLDGRISVRGRMLDSRVEILDQAGAVIQDIRKPGVLRVSNPYVNCDYVGRPDAKAKVWRNGFFQSGDIAAWGPQRELIILGRADQLINLGGMKIDPNEVEEILQRERFVTGAVVMRLPRPTTPPRLIALVTLADRSKADESIAEAQLLCEQRLPSAAIPALIFVVNDIPRTGDGTPKRAACAKLAEDLMAQIEKRLRQDHAES